MLNEDLKSRSGDASHALVQEATCGLSSTWSVFKSYSCQICHDAHRTRMTGFVS